MGTQKVVAAVLAAGAGERMLSGGASRTPKQFLRLRGKPVWFYSVEVFMRHSGVDEVCLVISPSGRALYEETWEWLSPEDQALLSGLRVLEGGSRRSDSSLRAIRYCQRYIPEARLLIHDAARPLLPEPVITDCLRALERASAVVCAVPARDSLFISGSGPAGEPSRVEELLPRSSVMRSQTPQGFHLDVIAEAFERGSRDRNFAVTDDVEVLRRYSPDKEILVVKGSERNQKLTYPEDLAVLESWLSRSR